jgi:thiol-disulfide isomerase/thioredoxin
MRPGGARRRLARVLAVALLLAASGCASSPEEGLRTAPPFELPKLVGPDSLSLEDLRGQYVLMNFWASWCGPCREEVPALLRIHRRFAGTGLTVLGVTVSDRPEDSRGFAHEYGIEYISVIGNDRMAEDYRLSPWIPTTLLVGPDGRILKEWVGPQTEATFLDGIRAAAPHLQSAAADSSAAPAL